MSFKDLERKAEKIEGDCDIKPEVGSKKGVSDLPDSVPATKSARSVAPLDEPEDFFDNMPV